MSETMTEKEKTKATGNPYLGILEELSRKRRRSPETIIRGFFALFCARVWAFRAKNVFMLDVNPDELKKYEEGDFLGSSLTQRELEAFTESDKKRHRLETHLQTWLEGLELFSRSKAQYIIDINDDIERLFSCLKDFKASIAKGREVAYIDMDKIKQFEPLLKSYDERKLNYILILRACALICKVICDFYDVPDIALRTLSPYLAKILRGLNSSPVLDGAFFCRFPSQRATDLRMALARNQFYKLNDYSIITILSLDACIDQKKLYEALNKRKNPTIEGLSFDKYLEEVQNINGIFAKEKPSIFDYIF